MVQKWYERQGKLQSSILAFARIQDLCRVKVALE